MQDGFNFSGVIAPVATPFGVDGAPDAGRFVDHAEWLLGEGCRALVPFGTTGEGNSISLDERMELLEEIVERGIDPALLMPGTGGCALDDTIALTQLAMDLGCGGVLTLPPFYYKNPTEEGLFRFFAEVIEEVGDDRLCLYLYHFPFHAVIGFQLGLIERLVTAFPGIVVGLKDSSGDWAHMKSILDADLPDFEFFPGTERLMLDALRLGAAGCITSNANIVPRRLADLYDNWQGDEADKLQADATAFRKAMDGNPMIPAIKGFIAHFRDDPGWARVKPPLMELSPAEIETALQALGKGHGFKMDIGAAV